jgi:hypothetical protein
VEERKVPLLQFSYGYFTLFSVIGPGLPPATPSILILSVISPPLTVVGSQKSVTLWNQHVAFGTDCLAVSRYGMLQEMIRG